MSEINHLIDSTRRAYEGDAWHGPSLAEILSGVTARQAGARCGKSHTIWELALHIAAWLEVPRRRLEGERLSDKEITWTDNWPPVPESTEDNWQQTLEIIGRAHKNFLATLASFPATGSTIKFRVRIIHSR